MVLDKKGQSDIVYLDFAKVFDSVPYPKLLQKLEGMGINGYCLGWIRAFLTGRIEVVCVEGQNSDPAQVTSGVPQGGVLSPTFFLCYVNDLLFKLRYSKGKLYADDAKICLRSDHLNNPLHLQEDLNAIADWARDWQMRLSIGKCTVMHAARNPSHNLYHIGDTSLSTSAQVKDLGVYISSNLRPSYHCQKNYSGCSKNFSLHL
jgi:hypothetical protein